MSNQGQVRVTTGSGQGQRHGYCQGQSQERVRTGSWQSHDRAKASVRVRTGSESGSGQGQVRSGQVSTYRPLQLPSDAVPGGSSGGRLPSQLDQQQHQLLIAAAQQVTGLQVRDEARLAVLRR